MKSETKHALEVMQQQLDVLKRGLGESEPEPVEKYTPSKGTWVRSLEVEGLEFLFNGYQNLTVGFRQGKWYEDFYPSPSNRYELMSASEIEAALIKEAEKRGFKDKVTVKMPDNFPSNGDDFCRADYAYDTYRDALYGAIKGNGGACLYHEGQWATIVAYPPLTIGSHVVEITTHPLYGKELFAAVNGESYSTATVECMIEVASMKKCTVSISGVTVPVEKLEEILGRLKS